MKISSNFDAGNITCLSCEDAKNIRLEINKDNQSDFYQWFYFLLTGAKNRTCQINVENAGGAAFAQGWDGYQARASYDRDEWFLVPTSYKNGVLTINHMPISNNVYYAYFAPYSLERHADLIARSGAHPDVEVSSLGKTHDGQDLDMLTIGTPGVGKKNMWVIARQHPGEVMAEWWIEGFLGRLLDTDDLTVKTLRETCVFHVAPNMNPDGSKRGNLRTNATGANLNREWGVATKTHSPEVLYVMQEMKKTGVDFNLDVHGDETLPYNFIAGSEGIPNHTPKAQARHDAFLEAYKRVSPDFQTEYGYDLDAPGQANLTLATNYVAHTYDCLAMTLEMPFKDNANLPDAHSGWSPRRAIRLGADVLDPMLEILPKL